MHQPLMTLAVQGALRAAADAGQPRVTVSLDLGRTHCEVEIDARGWTWQGRRFDWIDPCRERTVYHWDGREFAPVARYTGALVKLVPTEWGPPTFEIDGIKMLPTAQVSPWTDAARKVALVAPRGARVLDTCGGLGYFAAHALEAGAAAVRSFEKNPDVLWLREHNPWSPRPGDPRFVIECADVLERLGDVASESCEAVLHDPPRFGIAGDLYSQHFYDGLARVLVPRGRLFHYTGTPNRLTSGRDVPREVAARLQRAGFVTRIEGDGVVGEKRAGSAKAGRSGGRAGLGR